jgi:hypothetical protein
MFFVVSCFQGTGINRSFKLGLFIQSAAGFSSVTYKDEEIVCSSDNVCSTIQVTNTSIKKAFVYATVKRDFIPLFDKLSMFSQVRHSFSLNTPIPRDRNPSRWNGGVHVTYPSIPYLLRYVVCAEGLNVWFADVYRFG